MSNKTKKNKKRNPVVLEMIEMKGYGKHVKSNKAIRKNEKKKVRDNLNDDLLDVMLGYDW